MGRPPIWSPHYLIPHQGPEPNSRPTQAPPSDAHWTRSTHHLLGEALALSLWKGPPSCSPSITSPAASFSTDIYLCLQSRRGVCLVHYVRTLPGTQRVLNKHKLMTTGGPEGRNR